MGNEIYINLQKSWFEKNKAKFAKAAEEDNQDSDGYLIKFEPNKVELTESSVTGGTAMWSWDVPGGFVSIDYQPDNDDYLNLAQMVIKRLNKLKTAIEALNE